MSRLVSRFARWSVSGALLLIAPAAFAQFCPIPGNPCGGGDNASQSGLNGPTGAGNPIDVTNGNKYQLETDIAWSGELAAVFRRHYNSLNGESREFGVGWSHGYETRLKRDQFTPKKPGAEPVMTIEVTQADGRVIAFVPEGAVRDGVQRFVSKPAGYGVIEERDADLARLREKHLNAVGVVADDMTRLRPWSWLWANGRRVDFDGQGLARRIAGLDGEFVTLDYDRQARLARVRDARGRTLELAYWDDARERLKSFDAKNPQPADAAGAAKGRLRAITSPLGNIEYAYDPAGLLSEVRFADGTRTRYEYATFAGRPRLTKIVGRDGKVVGDYGYDAAGRAVHSSAPGNLNSIDVEYRADVKTLGKGETWLKNSAGEVSVYRWRYTPGENSALLLEALGPGCSTCATTNVRYGYDARGRVSRIERLEPGARGAWDPSPRIASSESIEYDAAGRYSARYRNAGGAARELVERWEYASPGAGDLRPVRITRPSIKRDADTTLDIEYDREGRPLALTERGFAPDLASDAGYRALERVTRYGYFGAGAAKAGKLEFIDGPLPGNGDVSRYEYDTSGLLTAIHHPENLGESFKYDVLGRIATHVAADTLPTAYEYDAQGRLARLTRAGLALEMGYDERGRLVALADPLGQKLAIGYDAASRVLTIEDTQKNRIEYERDAEGHVLAERLHAPDGSLAAERAADSRAPEDRPELAGIPRWIPPPRAFNFTASVGGFDARLHGELGAPGGTSLFDGRGLESRVVRDDFGRFALTVDRDLGQTIYRYDEADRLVERTLAGDLRTAYEYDRAGRVTRVVTGDDDVRVEYGRFGKPARIAYAAGEETFLYDERGEPAEHTRLIDGHTLTTRNQYDEFGRMIERRLPDGTRLRYRYNPRDHAKPGVLAAIERIDMFGSTPILSGLNEAADGVRSSAFLYGNGLAALRELDSRGAYLRYGTPGVAEYRTTPDGDGRVLTATGAGAAESFRYDENGRLAGMGRALSSAQVSSSQGFKYDLSGNLLRAVSEPGALRRYGVDAGSNRVLYRLDADGSRTDYRYDAAGRLLAVGARAFEYDGSGRLARVLEGGKPLAEYRYNSFGERIRKTTWSAGRKSVTYFFYDDSQLVAEADEGGEITRQYLYHESQPVALLADGDIYAVHTDWRGAPVAVTNDARAVVWKAEVDAFGAARVVAGSVAFNLRGSNQYFDAESGLHYNTHRVYDPALGRYLTPDPLGPAASRNVYAFAEGDPANFVDLLGLQQTPARRPFNELTLNDKVSYVFNRAAQLYPGEVGEALRAMVSPTALATTALILGAWAASHAFGVGEVADVIMAGLAWFFIGKSVVDVLSALVDASLGIANARCYEDLDRAGQRLADGAREVTVALAASAGAAAVSKVGGIIRNLLGRAPAIRNPPPRAYVPPRMTLSQLVNELRTMSRFLPMSRVPSMPRNDGRLGEQIAKQIVEAETGGVFRSIQNASGNGADLVRINTATRTIEHIEVKSSQIGQPGWPQNLANRFTGWINGAANNNLAGQAVTADTRAFAQQIQNLIAQGYTVEHRVAQVTIPPPGTTGSALFRLFNWP